MCVCMGTVRLWHATGRRTVRLGRGSSEPACTPEEPGGWQQGLVQGWLSVTGPRPVTERVGIRVSLTLVGESERMWHAAPGGARAVGSLLHLQGVPTRHL